MIEIAQMLVNLDAILSAEGLDAISIGPSVLPLSLGCKPMFDDVEPRAEAAIEHIVKRAKAHGVFAAIHNGRVDAAQARVDPGFRFVALPSEARLPAVGRRNCWGRWGPDSSYGGRKTATAQALPPGPSCVGGPCKIRTCDQRIKSPLLYQLS